MTLREQGKIQIRCTGSRCSFNYSPKDCPQCRGAGWIWVERKRAPEPVAAPPARAGAIQYALGLMQNALDVASPYHRPFIEAHMNELRALSGVGVPASETELRLHSFKCWRHGVYEVKDARHCAVMAAQCPQCEHEMHTYNAENVGGRLGPMDYPRLNRCVCRSIAASETGKGTEDEARADARVSQGADDGNPRHVVDLVVAPVTPRPASPRPEVEQLPARWRERKGMYRLAYEVCADELDAALSALAVPARGTAEG